ncbi:uncharacterized protein LOC116121092 [Pistacia vera]|uniref:uncharacterized protein LOC116121092 n=1 Tax=Pistacia vera TaxID=55513 RepID=UPI0012632111|nr:uncharacterized protein LOC116121092 [Pistacia vera]
MGKKEDDTNSQTRNYNAGEPEEDALLVCGMLHLVDTGKVVNGTFKNGAFQDLHKYMQERLPEFSKKANPHIKSRHKYVKKQYQAICEMRGDSCSGFEWDSKRYCITADESVFEEVKFHPNTHGLINKPFPYFDQLARIFGKDQAIGAAADSPANVVEELEREEQMQGLHSMHNVSSHTLLDDENEEIQSQFMTNDSPNNHKASHVAYSTCNQNANQAGPSTCQQQHAKKKQKTSDTKMLMESFSCQMSKLKGVLKGAGEHISKLADCFQHKQDAAMRRKKIYEELKKIDDILKFKDWL